MTAVQDTLHEGNETTVVDISTVSGGTETGTQQVTATIADDDPAPGVTLSQTGSPLAEAAGQATVTATLSAVSGLPVTVILAFSGSATLTDDYTRSGTSITIPAGQSTGTITLTAVQDTLHEGNETTVVDISTVSGGTETGTQQVTATITDDDPAPGVTLSLAGSPLAEAGGQATVTATLSAVSGLPVTVNLAFLGSATLTDDYTRSGTSITIPAGQTTGSITLTAVQDTLHEGDETIVVDISTVSGGTETGTQQVTATIADDDPAPGVTLSLAGSPLAEAGGQATVTATLSAVSGLPVTVNLAFSGSATLTDDYTRSGTSITIPAGQTTGSITLTAVQDTLHEGNETIVVDISTVSGGTETGTQQVTATITDDDPAPGVRLSLTGSPLAEAGGQATVTATLSAVSGLPVTVNVVFSGSATLTDDCTRSGTSITISAGQTTGSITLTAVQDTLHEGDETIVVDISTVSGGTETGTQQVTATIADDDGTGPGVTLSLVGSPLAEFAGQATVTATLAAVSGLPVTVNLAYSGSATLTDDYTRSGTSITIPAGQTSGSIALTAVQDTLYEGKETIVVDIATVSGGTETGTQQVTATITDDDPAPGATLSLLGSPLAEAAEQATVTATLSAVSGMPVTVALAYSGSATLTDDYTRSGTSITIPAGQTTGSITLTAVQDTLYEGNETIVVDISTVSGGTETGTQQVTATIAEDDPAPGVTLSLTGSPLAEAAGPATVTATLAAVSGLPVTVNLAFSGSATLTDDYTRSGTSITIPAGQTTGSITLTAVQDTLYEGNETIVVDISTVSGGTETGTQQVTATITDDDPAPGVRLSLTGSPLAEAAGQATVTATLSAVSGLPVTVNLAYSGSATLTDDYTRSGTSITIPAGQTTGTITLTAVQDTLYEVDETIVVDISTVSGGTEAGVPQVTATITDDDPLELEPIGARFVDELATLTFTISAIEVALPTGLLTYSAAGLPGGASFDPLTRTFRWTPTEIQGPGTYEVTFAVSDGSATDSELVTITVAEVNVAPELSVIANQTVNAQATLSFSLSAASDRDLPTQTLTYSLDAASVTAGMTIDPSSGEFRWTPSESLGGSAYSVTVTVTDNGMNPPNLTAMRNFTITVSEVNAPPTVSLSNVIGTWAEDIDTTAPQKVADIIVTDDSLGLNNLSLNGADAAWFEIVGTGLYLKAHVGLDFETHPRLDVTVAVDDPTVGATPDSSATLAVTLTDVNEPPTATFTNQVAGLPETTDLTSRVRVADIVIVDDALGTNTLSVAGEDAARFEIVGGALYLKANTPLDYEAKPSLSVGVSVDDPAVGWSPDAAVVMTIDVMNNAPTVTVNRAVGQADPASDPPIFFTVVFSEPVTGFDVADVSLGGTAGATTVVVTPQAGGATYQLSVSGMVQNGTVLVSILADAARDGANAGNVPSTSTDNAVTYVGVWQNVILPCDVNADGIVGALDVLLIINYINVHPDDISLPPPGLFPPPYYDVTNDRKVTPSDVLTVINYINSHLSTGEGEAARLPLVASRPSRTASWPTITNLRPPRPTSRVEQFPAFAVASFSAQRGSLLAELDAFCDLDSTLDDIASNVAAAWAAPLT